MTRSVGVGIFGYGDWARHYALAIQAEHDAQLLAVCGPNKERCEKFATSMGIPAAYTNQSEFLSLPSLDAVCVVTPDHTHYELVLAAATAGKHVICEKPLGMHLAQAKTMAAAIAAHGLVGITGFTLRASPIRQRVRCLVQRGALGKLHAFLFEFSRPDLLKPTVELGWRADPSRTPAGVVSDLGIHMFDQVLWLVGSISSVSAFLHTENTASSGSLDGDAVVLVKCKDGPRGTIRVSRADAMALRSPYETAARMTLWSDQAAVVVNGWWPDAALLFPASGGTQEIRPAKLNDKQQYQMHPDQRVAMVAFFVRMLVDAILRGAPADSSLADGVAAQAVLDATLRAARENRWIEVPQISSD